MRSGGCGAKYSPEQHKGCGGRHERRGPRRRHRALHQPYIVKERPECGSQLQDGEAGCHPLQHPQHVAEHTQGHGAGITGSVVISILQQLCDMRQKDEGFLCLHETHHLFFMKQQPIAGRKALSASTGFSASLPSGRAHHHGGGKSRVQRGRVDGTGSLPTPQLSPSPPDPLGKLLGNQHCLESCPSCQQPPPQLLHFTLQLSIPWPGSADPTLTSLMGRAGSRGLFLQALMPLSLQGTGPGRQESWQQPAQLLVPRKAPATASPWTAVPSSPCWASPGA